MYYKSVEALISVTVTQYVLEQYEEVPLDLFPYRHIISFPQSYLVPLLSISLSLLFLLSSHPLNSLLIIFFVALPVSISPPDKIHTAKCKVRPLV